MINPKAAPLTSGGLLSLANAKPKIIEEDKAPWIPRTEIRKIFGILGNTSSVIVVKQAPAEPMINISRRFPNKSESHPIKGAPIAHPIKAIETNPAASGLFILLAAIK